MNVFDLFAKISIDTSDYKKGVSESINYSKNLKSELKNVDKQVEALSAQYKASVNSTGRYSEETKKLADQLKEAKDKQKDLREELKSSNSISEKFGSGFGKIGSVLGTAAKGAGVFTAAVGAVGMALNSVEESTREYRTAMGKLETAFETAGYGANVAQEAYSGLYQILGDTDTATEAAQLMAKLTDSAEDVAEWVNIAAGAYGTFGDALPINSLIEATNETVKVGEVTGVLADALNWAGISEDEFNAKLADCSNEAERNQLVMETLSATYDDASDAFYENNEQLVQNRENQQKLDDAMADVGESVSKLKNAFLNEYTPAIETAAGATAGFLDTLSDPSTWSSIGQNLTYLQTFFQQIITGDTISGAKDTAQRVAQQYYVTSGEAARQAAKEAQAADDSVVSNAQKNAFVLQQNAKKTSESVSNTVTNSAEKTSSKVTTTAKKATQKQKTLFEQLSESFKTVSQSYDTNANVATLQLEIWQNQFGETATASEQMQKQTETLNVQLAEQKKAVDAAQSAYDKIVASYGAASNEAQQFHETLLQETADYQALQKQVEETAKSITDAAYKSVTETWDTKASIASLQFESWSNQFADTAEEADKLSEQLESLKVQEEAQKQVVDAAQKAYDDLVAAYGETSDEALEYKEILLQETIAHQELQKKIDDTTEALKKATDETEQFKIAAQSALEETGNFSSSLTSLGNDASDLGDMLGITVVSDLGVFISSLGSGISTVLSFSNSISGLISNVGNLSTSLTSLFSTKGGGNIATALLGGSAALGFGMWGKGVSTGISKINNLWSDSSKSGVEKVFGTLGNALWYGSGIGGFVDTITGASDKLANAVFGEKEEELSESLHESLPDDYSSSITTGTVSGVTTSKGDTIIEKVEIYIEGSQYKDEDSLAEAISIKLQNLTERRVNVFA